MHRIIAAFAFIVGTMWFVIGLAELFGDGGVAVVFASFALSAAFDFAGFRLLTKPPERFRG